MRTRVHPGISVRRLRAETSRFLSKVVKQAILAVAVLPLLLSACFAQSAVQDMSPESTAPFKSAPPLPPLLQLVLGI